MLIILAVLFIFAPGPRLGASPLDLHEITGTVKEVRFSDPKDRRELAEVTVVDFAGREVTVTIDWNTRILDHYLRQARVAYLTQVKEVKVSYTIMPDGKRQAKAVLVIKERRRGDFRTKLWYTPQRYE